MAKKLISFDDEAEGHGLPTEVMQRLHDHLGGGTVVVGGSGGGTMPMSTASMQARAENSPAPATTPTADGSGETVHPSVVYVPEGWNGYRYWMLVTGYAGSKASLENPHLLASHDGQAWEGPPGISNPIKATPPGGWNSDTDLVLVDGTMYCFYRSTIGTAAAPTHDAIYVQTTKDAATFTAEQLVIESTIGTKELLSPTLVYNPETGTWRMWAVNGSTQPRTVLLFESTSQTGPWEEIGPATGFTTPLPTGRDLWHIEVREHGGELTAIYCDSPAGVSSYGSLWRAVSRDGLTWDADPHPVLEGVVGSWDYGIYRSSAVPATIDGVSGYILWYSAYSGAAWNTAMTTIKLAPREQSDMSALLAANRTPGWLVGDLVDRPDSTTGPGVTTSGHAWTSSVGTMGVKSRTLSPVTEANSNALIDLGTPDMDVSVQIDNGSQGVPWLVARAGGSGRGHLSFVRFGTTSNLLYYTLEWFDHGAQPVTVLGSHLRKPRAGDLLRLVCKGDRIRAYVNGYLLMDYTVDMPVVKGQTLAGVQSVHPTQGLYNFAARPADKGSYPPDP